MKKKYLLIFALLLFIPVVAFADENPKVLTLTSESTSSTINYSGTMEDDSYAVMCKLINSNDEEIDMLSVAVENNAFAGSFTGVQNGTYDVACANYSGGEFKKVEVTVTGSDVSTNPHTYDNGIRNSVIILVISVAGIIGSIIYIKRRNKQKNN